ncbi:MAG: phosphoribosylformylglycinamidine synthase subunit PurL [Elusimicrobia bacterium CG_4_10_14_0_2_um_filter_56_8]|nr:MAG: phosphoribosylformylglycinamidine synthase II [Elusimicrobia bacterium CG1_02_56_21]PJA14359.1 MAG: phosphoribosylformylglycinamidine synthase subunit PurL [Elusimicrobia bacterium CG_4_10_14_0_2_um_filter_56_8]
MTDLLSNFTSLSKKQLAELDGTCGWSLSALELAEVQRQFRGMGRQPSRGELETIAQTWSEHCKHKTFSGPVAFRAGGRVKKYKNLFKETIVRATRKLNKKWCLSVFTDNAGIVQFGKSGKWGLAFKAETHNHPCAVEPYGGAETGVGGVIRDILGVGLGAKPVLNTDSFCFGYPDSKKKLPGNSHPPERIMRGVVEGVRDYGNRMGIPTAAGGIYFDDGYLLNPLVYVGCAGLIPVEKIAKKVMPGDLIVSIGGRTGRDGIHGATFSSANIEEDTSASAVQIGHAINEKKTLDVLMRARDLGLYNAVTDCGAGGFSSAIGELGSQTGARVRLENAQLKDSLIEPWEIWVSESQERMILSVPKARLAGLEAILKAESCDYCVLGTFPGNGRLLVTHGAAKVVDLPMAFLHGGVPNFEKPARRRKVKISAKKPARPAKSYGRILKAMLAHPNVCSRHSVINQYDHEVQGGTVIKPMQGKYGDGPGDAAVIWPQAATLDLSDFSGFAVSHGFNPAAGKLDPYQMALHSVDEAVRNLLCVGAEISRTAILDNFCAASPRDPEVMGDLVLAAEGCHDAAMAYGAPFISGKDSFYNQAKDAGGNEYPIPISLLISATAPVEDIRKAITMNFKEAGSSVYLAGVSRGGMGGSVYNDMAACGNNFISPLDMKAAVRLYTGVLKAIKSGCVPAAHDVSQGGLAVTLAEMAFSGGFGAEIDLCDAKREDGLTPLELLFGESPARLVLEVVPGKEHEFLKLVRGLPVSKIGCVRDSLVLEVRDAGARLFREDLSQLKKSWKRELI